jgi:hypothetical protein
MTDSNTSNLPELPDEPPSEQSELSTDSSTGASDTAATRPAKRPAAKSGAKAPAAKPAAKTSAGTASKKDTADPDAKKKVSTAALAALVAVGAIVAGALAFGATRLVLSATSDPCQEAISEIRTVMGRVPDSSTLNIADDRTLAVAAEKLRSNCTYYQTMEFETLEVFPWLGVEPSSMAPSSGGTPLPGSEPSTPGG